MTDSSSFHLNNDMSETYGVQAILLFARHALLSLWVNLCTFAYYSMTFPIAFLRCVKGLVNFDWFLLCHTSEDLWPCTFHLLGLLTIDFLCTCRLSSILTSWMWYRGSQEVTAHFWHYMVSHLWYWDGYLVGNRLWSVCFDCEWSQNHDWLHSLAQTLITLH